MRTYATVRRWACVFALSTATITTFSLTTPAAADTQGTGFKASKSRVPFAGSVILRGGFQERARSASSGDAQTAGATAAARPASNRQVSIEYRVAGSRSWKVIGHARTGSKGRFKKGIRLRRTGYLRARLADGTTTAKRRVRVKSRLKSRVKRRHVDVGRSTKVVGRISPGTAGRKVVVKVGGQTKRARTRSGGRFKVRLRLGSTGTRKVVVKAKSDKAAAGDRRRAGRVTAYRRAMASWYGPGFYGNRTACGQVLGYDTVGVAHRTMPCGTKIRIRHGNRTINTRVIDRGPYHSGREFDLTGAAKRKLGFGSTGYIQVNK